MKCPKCNTELPDQAHFCPYCGPLEHLTSSQVRLDGDGTLAQGNQATAVGAQGVNVGESVGGDVVTGTKEVHYHGIAPPGGAPTLDAPTALARYLAHTIAANQALRLQGIRSAGELVSIGLEDIYITLTATIRRAITADDEQRPGSEPPVERVEQVKVKVQEALASYSRLVVLGDPGSGKTTLLRYLALTYARDLLPVEKPTGEEGAVKRRLELDEQRLPVLLPLRDFARYLERYHPDIGADGPKLLLEYLRVYFENQQMPLPVDFFSARLEEGACAVLLDGMDEVAVFAIRQRVARIIELFTLAYPGNRYVVTSRSVGYTGAVRLGADYAVTTVRDFTWDDIERFVRQWTYAVEVTLAGEKTPYVEEKAATQAQVLLATIQKNDAVRALALNPLLLTVIALVHRYRAQLPERRTELYEEAVEVLLGKWDEAKGLTTTTQVRGVELDAGDRRSLLEPVALWMMEQRVREIETDTLRAQLRARFVAMRSDVPADKAVDDFLRLINERSGLLSERGPGIYTFSHLTFQEHLAARAVADRADYIAYTLARAGDSWWREVILLEAGYLSTQGKQRVTALVQALMDYKKEPEPCHNLALAAEALRDIGPARVEGDLLGEIKRRLRREIEQGSPLLFLIDFWGKVRILPILSQIILALWPLLSKFVPTVYRILKVGGRIPRRSAAAQALTTMSGIYWDKKYGEPEWVEIPAGEFWMGDDQDSRAAPRHQVYLERFWIARTPITNAQYYLFVKETGYKVPQHWEDGRPSRKLENHPVMFVTWRDVLAYCNWLAQMTGKSITLPSEAQWEKAARGTDGRKYPWGNEWDKMRCNSVEFGIGNTTPVGAFPDGASPYGCLDMAGNGWEWTRSLWGLTGAAPTFVYPYIPNDGREDLYADITIYRVLRGGPFNMTQGWMCCVVRDWAETYREIPWNTVGFRIVNDPNFTDRR